ncbi:class I SAM-dependent methyltransferase [Cyanobium sp. FGCU-52]|nr:class I SAM-dependent methyltransferase [Cyanobium sp. FGCU52]
MDRIPEPELMDEAPQARAYAEADFSLTDQAFTERFHQLVPEPGPRIVDLGCGPGNVSFRIAAACPHAEVVGIDGAAAMLAIAAERQWAAGVAAERLRFLQLDLADGALTSPPLAGSFSAVVSNSVLHHLHDPQVFWAAVRRLGAPGALVVVRDLRRPATLQDLETIVAREAAEAPPILRRDYRASLHAAFTTEEVEDQLRRAGLTGWRVEPLEDRYLEVWGQLTASPAAGTTPPAAGR